jgi:hypothetical protein
VERIVRNNALSQTASSRYDTNEFASASQITGCARCRPLAIGPLGRPLFQRANLPSLH